MTGDLSKKQEIDLLNFFAEITAISGLDELMDHIVQKVPRLLNVRRCSIYLTPEYVPQYTGELIDDPNIIPIPSSSINGEFIVLARTNYPGKQEYIGKIFYPSGSDLTGWVFKSGRVLRLRDAHDPSELRKIDPDLKASVRYRSVETETDFPDKFPILYLPLHSDSKIIGVFKLHQPFDLKGFTKLDEKIGKIIGQIIAGLIKKDLILHDQARTIFNLGQLGAEDEPSEVCRKISGSIKTMLNCQYADVYLLDKLGECLVLKYRNGQEYSGDLATAFCSGEGLVGWVYKTGKPLIIEDLREFCRERTVTDELLSQISDGPIGIDENSRTLEVKKENRQYIMGARREVPFLAVPVFAYDNSIQGIIVAHCISRHSPDRKFPFTRLELQQLITFASTLSLSMQSDLTRKRADFLLHISQSQSLDMLFEKVSWDLPGLLRCSDCFIYDLDRNNVRFPVKLKNSSRGKLELNYEIGQGKTGFVALAEKTLIISYFGRGENKKIQMSQYKKNIVVETEDLITDLIDDDGEIVGCIILRNGKRCALDVQKQYNELCKKQIIGNYGLPSENLSAYTDSGARPSLSFVGVPIIKDGELGGVITFEREYGGIPFDGDSLQFVKAIASSLAAIIDLLKLQNNRKELLVTLAHEITTPLTSVHAHAENINFKVTSNPDLERMSRKLMDQISRLEMTTETILAVSGGKVLGRNKFEIHSLFRPLMEAIEPFRDEAEFAGCEIKKPKTQNSEGFPNVEMSLSELMLAFRNLIQNAIKYSFRPTNRGDIEYRYISIWGEWADVEKHFYKLNIQNYGVGITEDELRTRKIFQPFYRGVLSSDRKRTGSGFGLAYADKVVREIHHGSIEAVSKFLGGEAYLTTFMVILPLRQIYARK